MKREIQIIYLNGPSSSGKTVFAKALQNSLAEPFLSLGIDDIIGWMPEKINDWEGGEAPLGFSWKRSQDESGRIIQELQMGPFAKKMDETFREVVLALANMGHYIIVDDVSVGKEQFDKWRDALKSFPVLWIGVNAPLFILEEREKGRGDRIVGSARGQSHKVHVDVAYDVVIDTHESTESENIEKVKASACFSIKCQKPSTEKKMKITLSNASKEDKETIQNLGHFYMYEMSRYCGFNPGWETPTNGLFECADLNSYCEERDRHAFLIKVNEELAGFVLINKVGSTPDVDWNIGEFFVVSKFQGKGVGSYVAKQIFKEFPGIWETMQIPENGAAIDFWERVVAEITHGRFEKTLKTIPEPKPHPMVVLKFTSKED